MESIGDTRGFSSNTPIIPSGSFSVETLTGLTPSWKMEYPEGCSTVMRRIVRKVAAVESRLVCVRGGITAGCSFPDRWTCI